MRTRKPEVTELEVNREHNPVRLLLRKDWQHIPQFQVHSDSQEVRLAELTDTRTAKGYAWCSLQAAPVTVQIRNSHAANAQQPWENLKASLSASGVTMEMDAQGTTPKFGQMGGILRLRQGCVS